MCHENNHEHDNTPILSLSSFISSLLSCYHAKLRPYHISVFPSFLLSHLLTFFLSFSPSFFLSFFLFFSLSLFFFLSFFLSIYLSIYVPFLPSYLPSFLPSYLLTYRDPSRQLEFRWCHSPAIWSSSSDPLIGKIWNTVTKNRENRFKKRKKSLRKVQNVQSI